MRVRLSDQSRTSGPSASIGKTWKCIGKRTNIEEEQEKTPGKYTNVQGKYHVRKKHPVNTPMHRELNQNKGK